MALPSNMIDTSRHIRIGGGLTAEFMEGVVILFRLHKDPDAIPGDLAETFVARETADGFEMVAKGDEVADWLFHADQQDHREHKAYTGKMLSVDQRRIVRRFLEQINLGGAKVHRAKNKRKP